LLAVFTLSGIRAMLIVNTTFVAPDCPGT
jgi:hypothetical protein